MDGNIELAGALNGVLQSGRQLNGTLNRDASLSGTVQVPKEGEDGYSPTVDVYNQIEAWSAHGVSNEREGFNLEITDVNGARETQNIMEAWPVVMDSSKSNGVTTVNLYTNSGTADATLTINDGIDGVDGVSPTAAVTDITGGHRLTITDENGTTTVDVMDGVDGQGVPAGGTSGQYLKKKSNDDYDTEWVNMTHPTERYWATYGTTTSAEIETAYQAKKVILCEYNDLIYRLVRRVNAATHIFVCLYSLGQRTITCASNNWSYESRGLAETASPTFTGTPTAPTASYGTDSTQIATTAFVQDAVDGVHESPSGGTTGQVLAKASGTDYDTEWKTLDADDVGAIEVPSSANDGDVLTYDDGEWVAAPPAASHDLPSGGTSGQVLAKASGTDYDVEWVNQTGGGVNSWFGACETAADTATKEVTITGFTSADLVAGVHVTVNFKYGNSAEGPKLKINDLTAINITDEGYDRERLVEHHLWKDKSMVDLVYTGYLFVIAAGWQATLNNYGMTILSIATDSNEFDVAATPYAVKQVKDSIPAAATATPSDLGTAAVGSSAKYAKEDHVHKKPTAAELGVIAAPSDPNPGQSLIYNNNKWEAASVDYTSLSNKPKINNVELSGNVNNTSYDLHLVGIPNNANTGDILVFDASEGEFYPKPMGKIWSGPSQTPSTTPEKAVNVTGFTSSDLADGTMVTVLFLYKDTTGNPSLNINNTGAHTILEGGDAINPGDMWDDEQAVTFIYVNGYWVITNHTILENDYTSSSSYTAPTSYALNVVRNTKIDNPSSKSTGQFLKWDGDEWIAADAPGGGLPSGGAEGQVLVKGSQDAEWQTPAIGINDTSAVGSAIVGTAETDEPNYTPSGTVDMAGVTLGYSYDSANHKLIFSGLSGSGTFKGKDVKLAHKTSKYAMIDYAAIDSAVIE